MNMSYLFQSYIIDLLESKCTMQASNQPKIMGGAQSKILDLLRQFW